MLFQSSLPCVQMPSRMTILPKSNSNLRPYPPTKTLPYYKKISAAIFLEGLPPLSSMHIECGTSLAYHAIQTLLDQHRNCKKICTTTWEANQIAINQHKSPFPNTKAINFDDTIFLSA